MYYYLKQPLQLPDEYRKIVYNSEEIIKKYEQRSVNLNYLKILVENLLKDISKIRTISNIKDKIKELNLLFDDYDYDKLIDIFKELKNI